MPTLDLGIPQFTDEDAAYQGSRFRDVVDALFANPYQHVWGRAGEPPLPVYDVSFATVASEHFRDAAARTVDSGADLRWGADRKGFRRIVHPNGFVSSDGGRSPPTPNTRDTSRRGARHWRSAAIRRAARTRVEAGRVRCPWSGNSFRQPTLTMRRPCAPLIS